MNKSQLIELISDKSNLSKADSKRALDATLDAITQALSKKENVALVGFGTFSAEIRPERNGRNPQTGEALIIPATTAPKFKPGKELKDAVNKQ